MGLQAIRQYPFRVLPHSNALWLGTPNPLSFRILVFGVFHSFHKHIRSLRLIHSSNSLNLLGVSAKAKYPHHPIKYLFSFSILFSIGYGFDLDVVSRILFFKRFTLSFAIRIFGVLLDVKLKPRNFRFQGRSTADFFLFTLSFNSFSIKLVMEFMTRIPAFFVFT